MSEDEKQKATVESKYFISSAMDDSLSDFQEPKKTCAGPKNTAKTKPKAKKTHKRLKGQKDIRSVLKSTKKELESYSKDFDKVCKTAGIDVDSEELQLAIALSKSLQDTPPLNDCQENTKSTVKQRIGKIRSTLQEYGFKVPEVKIAGTNRRIKKYRKNYKLINTPDKEKKQIIANKYSYLLFNYTEGCSIRNSEIDISEIPIYYLASNASYNVLKLAETFYVSGLVEYTSSRGNMLRDWSTIPGRPTSPQLFETMNINFSEIECSEEELDIVLSGTINECKDIINKKISTCENEKDCRINVELDNNRKDSDVNRGDLGHNSSKKSNRTNTSVDYQEECILPEKRNRSCSPDLFDEESELLEDSNHTALETKSQNTSNEVQLSRILSTPEKSQCNIKKSNFTTRKSNDLMELTDCVPTAKTKCLLADETLSQMSQKRNSQAYLEINETLSQNVDTTKRTANDYMEITECVATSTQLLTKNIDLTVSPEISEQISQGIDIVKHIESEHTDIDLTQSPETNHNIDVTSDHTNTTKMLVPDPNTHSMDLTQSSGSSDELPSVSLTGIKDKTIDDTVIIDVNDYVHINNGRVLQTYTETHIDLTQIAAKSANVEESFFEEFIHEHSDSIEGNKENSPSNDSGLNKIIDSPSNSKQSPQKIIETIPVEMHKANKSNRSSVPTRVDLTLESNNEICLEMPILNNNSEKNTQNKFYLHDSNETNLIDDIDLTQKSDTEEDTSVVTQIKPNENESVAEVNNLIAIEDNDVLTGRKSLSYSSLGKQDGVSIDYDEYFNNNTTSEINEIKSKTCEKEKSKTLSRNNSMISNCSQQSEVFDLTDKELDYSIHQSKLEIPKDNYDFGGISIIDELNNLHENHVQNINNNGSNYVDLDVVENLPVNMNIHGKEIRKFNENSPIKHKRITEIATPQKAITGDIITVTTPQNSELVIRTNHVTPRKDYESMSTPEIHKELDKYGIKPFKRKRAIQLLTHIYNQTHPIIENIDDQASPPKRHKPNNYHSVSKKLPSPRKLITSPMKSGSGDLVHTDILSKSIENNCMQKGSENNTTSKGKGKGKRSRGNLKENQENIISDKENACKEINTLKEIECSPEDWVFQKREKAKVHSCRVPLHIAFYNYVWSRRDLREAILCYEPVEIDLIHKDLVSYGHRYDPKDLLKFLDKKCITVKTTDNDGRNQRR